jgi:hypothetical protein
MAMSSTCFHLPLAAGHRVHGVRGGLHLAVMGWLVDVLSERSSYGGAWPLRDGPAAEAADSPVFV